MQHQQLCDQIITLHQEMQDLTLQAGVPLDRYHETIDLDPRDSETDLLERLTFLRDVRAKEYERVREIWILLKPEHWQGYDLHEIKGLREQRLLEDARKALRNKWKARYGQKAKSDSKQDGNQSSNQE